MGDLTWQPAAEPANESVRLQELHSLGVLDSEAERRFDALSELALKIIGGEVCLISLVDADRQWFKAKCGLNENEHPREWSFCAHAVADDLAHLCVPDTHEDPRFHNNPLVQREHGIRSYLGCTLRGPTGLPLGSLCILDTQPRSFSTEQINHLSAIADLVSEELRRDLRSHKAQQGLAQVALYDPLTGLPNKRLFLEHVEAWCQASKYEAVHAAVLVINPRRFRMFNRTLGRELADAMLQEIANTLASSVPEGSKLARLGDDRFGLLISGRDPIVEEQGSLLAITNALQQPITVEGKKQRVDYAIGMAVVGEESLEAEELLSRASLALRRVSDPSPGTIIARFDVDQDEALAHTFEIEARMRSALGTEAFSMVYQPIVSLHEGGVLIGAEALVRWHEPDMEPVSPAEFIPIAEETGLILPLSQWIMRTACLEFAAICHQADRPLYLSVNISGAELLNPLFADQVIASLRESGLPPESLQLEVTEHSLISDIDHAITQMSRLNAMGVRFAIDDFGTGHASLRYLQLLPASVLKIDRSFIDGTPENDRDTTITRATIALAQSLGKKVVAEGVEHAGQAAFLLSEGAEYAQGWYFARPLAADSLLDYRPPSS